MDIQTYNPAPYALTCVGAVSNISATTRGNFPNLIDLSDRSAPVDRTRGSDMAALNATSGEILQKLKERTEPAAQPKSNSKKASGAPRRAGALTRGNKNRSRCQATCEEEIGVTERLGEADYPEVVVVVRG